MADDASPELHANDAVEAVDHDIRLTEQQPHNRTLRRPTATLHAPLCGAHAPQRRRPQPRQWWRRRSTVKGLLQHMQALASSSGTHAKPPALPSSPRRLERFTSSGNAPPMAALKLAPTCVANARIAEGSPMPTAPNSAGMACRSSCNHARLPSIRILRRKKRPGAAVWSASARWSVSTLSTCTVVSTTCTTLVPAFHDSAVAVPFAKAKRTPSSVPKRNKQCLVPWTCRSMPLNIVFAISATA
mmetsp:Transcript_108776/g.306538  ORF Transcript_108776/g.306538 Transcript_108776/m.306538 type:complete len:244 (-) Transcript_108776:67-798(-)